MTALNIATQIPSNIVTLEQIHAWSGFALNFINPNLGVLETPTSAQQIAQVNLFQSADAVFRAQFRVTPEIDSQYTLDRSKKIWMHVKEISTVQLPPGYTQN
jgi:hypothetical protein